ncbi:PREDICTED: uncharacterized protein LOC105525300 [Colobus angolensis palliatus]|uniref:uncharacterized protein LOC105525300 n=1 Tax=Colobus angolensis palliatus TaxID=336983 RepID=UPI0005F42766|nr:PREDICTED: uncharacterized protein LOC105525300 [Colobus angolensis palliatus]
MPCNGICEEIRPQPGRKEEQSFTLSFRGARRGLFFTRPFHDVHAVCGRCWCVQDPLCTRHQQGRVLGELHTRAPPRVSNSTNHKLEQRSPRISTSTTHNYKHHHQLLHGNANSASSTSLQLHDPQRETPTPAPPWVSSCMTLNEKHQQQLLAPQPSTRNTNNGSSAGLQLHDPQLETPTPALPQSLAPRSSTRNTNNSSSACLQLHDPQSETPTTAPARVSRSTTHKLENNSAPPRVSSCTTLKLEQLLPGSSECSPRFCGSCNSHIPTQVLPDLPKPPNNHPPMPSKVYSEKSSRCCHRGNSRTSNLPKGFPLSHWPTQRLLGPTAPRSHWPTQRLLGLDPGPIGPLSGFSVRPHPGPTGPLSGFSVRTQVPLAHSPLERAC